MGALRPTAPGPPRALLSHPSAVRMLPGARVGAAGAGGEVGVCPCSPPWLLTRPGGHKGGSESGPKSRKPRTGSVFDDASAAAGCPPEAAAVGGHLAVTSLGGDLGGVEAKCLGPPQRGRPTPAGSSPGRDTNSTRARDAWRGRGRGCDAASCGTGGHKWDRKTRQPTPSSWQPACPFSTPTSLAF